MFIAIDSGTTRTRAWLVDAAGVHAERRADSGVGMAARAGSNAGVVAALGEMVASLETLAGRRVPIVASGMIGSSLGLGHVPHLTAPAGVDDLASALRSRPLALPSGDDRPVWIVPGVRTSTLEDDDPGSGDVMRGEETSCVGALALGMLAPGDTLVSIGSHWKRIATDARWRVSASLTSMGGELVEAARTATLLADAVPGDWPSALSADHVEAGIEVTERVGLPRALFEVRLAQLARAGSPADRLALIVGAVIGADLVQWPRQPAGRLVLAGGAPLTDAWHRVLERRGWAAVRLTASDAERAHRAGLAAIATRAGLLPQA